MLYAENTHGKYSIPEDSAYTYTSRTILAGKVHEPPTIDYICANSGDGDIVHAGAGFGDFLPALSRTCKGIVYAYEPNTTNYYACVNTVFLNDLPNVNISPLGLGAERSHTAHLKIKDAGLALGVRSEVAEKQGEDTQCLEIDTLDNLLLVRSKKISLIHLDVEGYEFKVLDGAKQVIARDSPIIILEIDSRAVTYNTYMKGLNYRPVEQLIYNAGDMVFVNTVYKKA